MKAFASPALRRNTKSRSIETEVERAYEEEHEMVKYRLLLMTEST